MLRRLINTVTWLLVAGSVAIILGGLLGRPILLASVPTRSMVPTLNPGDVIPVVPFPGGTVRPGQILVFKTDKDRTWIVHRVVGGNPEDGFVTRGDANPTDDPYPVFPQHVAGIVPQVGGHALRIPRLGLVSLERSPLSNPLIAGIALVLGMYLMASDARTGMQFFRRPRLRRMPAPGPTPKVVLAVYSGLILCVFLVSFVTMWSLGSVREGRYTVVSYQSPGFDLADVMVAGREKTESLALKNPSLVPLIIGMASDDSAVRFEPAWVVVMPKTQRTIRFSILSNELGEHQPQIRQAVFLPLLPPLVLRALAGINWTLAFVVTALVPAVLIVGIAASDRRVWQQIHRIVLRLQYRMWA